MPERSSITQSAQIGLESTPGIAVAAPKRLGSMGFEIGPKIDTKTLKPEGQKYGILQILGKEWTEAKIKGMPTYPELPYALASCVNSPTVTQVMDGATPTGAYRWTFVSDTFTDDSPKTYTIEQGSSFRAHRFTNAIIPEYSWKWSRDSIDLDGSLLGKAIEDGITLTASPTLLPQVPVRPSELSVYMDAASGSLGTTKMLRTLKGEFGIADRFSPLWVVDAALPSFANTVEQEPTVQWKMTQMANQQAMDSLIKMRAGGTSFLRLNAVGPNIYTGSGGSPLIVNHQCNIDVAGQIEDVSPFSDEDGVYAIEWTFRAVHDPTWAKAFAVEVITTTAAL